MDSIVAKVAPTLLKGNCRMTNLSAAGIYFVLILITVLTILLAYIRDRHKLVMKHLIRLCMLAAGWQSFQAAYFLISNEALALWIFDAKLAFAAFAPIQVFLVSLRFYSVKISRNDKLFLGILCIIPTITAVLAFSSPFHNFLRAELFFEQFDPLRIVHNVRGIWFWIHSAYSYIIMVASIVIILFQHAKLPKGFHAPSTFIVIGSSIVLLSNFAVVFMPYTWVIDITLVGISPALILIYIGISISDESNLLMVALDNIFGYLKDIIFILNDNRFIIGMNPAANRWLQKMQIGEGNICFDYLLQQLISNNKESLRVNETGDRDFYLTVDQHISIYSLDEHPINGQDGQQIGTFAIFTDITRYRLIIQHLEQTAGVDPLTALGNRRSYEQELKRLDDPAFFPLAVILGDVNGLKFVNDSMGHATGDTMLRITAKVLSDACCEGAHAYRIGGDEFVLLLPQTSRKSAEIIANNIRDALVYNSRNASFDVSIALGIATKETMEQNLLTCIAQADSSMYLDKKNDRRAQKITEDIAVGTLLQ